MDWPESLDAPPLGDDRRAIALDRPESVAELREIVQRRVEQGLAIYPQGGKSSLDYGGIPRRPGIALDTTGLNRVIDYPAADMTITVEAGLTLEKLQSVLATEGQFLPLDAPHPETATLGGIYATNTSGPRRFGWGRPRDMIIGVSFVTADGKEVKGGGRVVKNVAGYDFPKLMTGSMGTLGVITQMTLKVRPKPESSALVAVEFDDNEAAIKAVEGLNTSSTRPVAIELLNRAGGELVGLQRATAILVVAYEDNADSVAWQVARLQEEMRPREARLLDPSEFAKVWAGLAGFQALEAGPFSFVASFARSQAALFVGLTSSTWAMRIHAGNGVVHAHYLNPVETAEQFFNDMSSNERALVDAITARCPTAWKQRHDIWGKPRGDWAIMEKIKQALDPASVMNPGRFVGTI